MTPILALRTHEEMKDVLKDTSAEGPSTHYYMLRGGSLKKNITVWESGTVGDEYIKTYGHYHVGTLPETYTIISGEGILLMQVRKEEDGKPIDDSITEVKAVYVKAGSSVHIPPKAGHLMVNTGESWLVSVDDSPVEGLSGKEASWPAHADYAPIKKLHGFAYYIVKQNNTPLFVKNPNYTEVPEITTENAL